MISTSPALLLLASLFAAGPLAADTAQANTALQQGRVTDAEQILRSTIHEFPSAALPHQLLCRVFYAQERPDDAVPECEAATAAAPSDSDSQMWLARAYGEKARRASPFAAYALARKVRATFERAVQLDPNNVAAISDLGEFYVQAPAIVGGSMEKARHLADVLQTRSPEKAHRLLAMIAAGTRDPATAEAQYKDAIAVAHSPGAYVDLGQFYENHGQTDQAVVALRAAIQADHARGPALVDAASILIDAERAPELAADALRAYLQSPAQSDSAPVFKAHLKLGKLLAQHGDGPGARREFAAALALAPNFEPARKAAKGV